MRITENLNTTSSNHPRIEVLDLLRSVAIIFVVITHLKYYSLPGGSVGVSIFFCLSGYLITKNLLIKEVTIPDFLIRRIFRIYPAYLVVCLLHCVVLYYTKSSGFSEYVAQLPNFLFIIKMPEKWMGYGVGVLWTLQIELWFYFLIPFIIKKTASVKRIGVIIALIFMCFLFKFAVLFDFITLPFNSVLRTLYWMDNLLYGSVVALLLESVNSNTSTQKEGTKTNRYGLKLLLACASLVIFAVAVYWPSEGKGWPFESSLVSFLTAIIIFYTQKFHLFQRGMTKIVSYLSLLAYAIYLCHPFLLDYYKTNKSIVALPTLEYRLLAFVLITSMVLSLHFFIERPGIKLGKKISGVIKR